MLDQLLHDERGAAFAEYALIMIIACGCLAVLALLLGRQASTVMYGVAQTITDVAVSIATGR